MTLSFSVLGTPAPQGSKQGFVNKHTGRVALVESSKAVRPWREAVKSAAREALDCDSLEDGFGRVPVEVSVSFYLRRPRHHYRTGTNSHLLRAGAPRWPAGKPDCSKLMRSTEDALTDAGVYADDAQIVRLAAVKLYADGRPPGAVIVVQEAQ